MSFMGHGGHYEWSKSFYIAELIHEAPDIPCCGWSSDFQEGGFVEGEATNKTVLGPDQQVSGNSSSGPCSSLLRCCCQADHTSPLPWIAFKLDREGGAGLL